MKIAANDIYENEPKLEKLRAEAYNKVSREKDFLKAERKRDKKDKERLEDENKRLTNDRYKKDLQEIADKSKRDLDKQKQELTTQQNQAKSGGGGGGGGGGFYGGRISSGGPSFGRIPFAGQQSQNRLIQPSLLHQAVNNYQTSYQSRLPNGM